MKLGGLDIADVKIGGTQVDKVYQGGNLVWEYVPPTGLLIQYPGALAAYSLRQLRSNYGGSAIRVRRASDNTELDIGFVGEDLDTSALTTFCSGTNGFVATIYDQSGGSNNYIQPNASRQGQIVSSGSVILLNSKPVIIRSVDDNGGYGASGLSFVGDTNVYGMYYVGNNNNTSMTLFGSYFNGSDYGYLVQRNNPSTLLNDSSVASSETLNGSSWIYSTRGDVHNDFLTQFLLSAGIQFNFSSTGLALGYRFQNPAFIGMASFQEQILYPSINNQNDINNLINSYYGIY
jgi:hypothetical protein